ncbi:MAG TPA: DUF2520 domain-containing protein [Candidatus Marinimicrobia bacterium]|nr:DUF2520 domain-containing protein [Candidatus Neomarinimicrobiota bacterium]
MRTKSDSFALIGASRTGLALASHLEKSGFLPAYLWNRSGAKFTAVCEFVNFQRVSTNLEEIPQNIDWIIIAVADDAICQLAGQIASLMPVGRGIRVFHLSGARDSSLLDDLERCHFRTGSLHPLISVPDISTGIRMMEGAIFSCEGAIAAELQRLVERIGGTGIRLQAEEKSLVHLCAVFVNNFQTVTIQAIKKLLNSRGISHKVAVALLETLSRQAVDYAWRKPLAESLTGPIARGDRETIDNHLNQLDKFPDLKQLYQQYVNLAESLLKAETESS